MREAEIKRIARGVAVEKTGSDMQIMVEYRNI